MSSTLTAKSSGRVGIASCLLEVACAEYGQDYEDELDAYLSLAAALLRD